MSSTTRQPAPDITGWLSDYAGLAFAKEVRRWIHRHPDGAPLPSVVAWLTSPMTVFVHGCGTGHEVHLDSKGTIAEFSGHTFSDIDSELMLLALSGARPSPCLVIYAVLSGHAETVAAMPNIDQSMVRAWRKLVVARAWAQPDVRDLTGEDRAELVALYVTPQAWEPYAQAGYSPASVRQFLAVGATVDQAKAWLDAKMYSKAAAQSAAQGRTPHFDIEEWTSRGLSEHAARDWYSRIRCTAETAAVLEGWGTNPAQVAKAITKMSLSTFMEWAQAGVDFKTIRAWYTARVSLTDALTWQRAGLRPPHYRRWGAALAHARLHPAGHTSSHMSSHMSEDMVLAAASTVKVATARAWVEAGVPKDAIGAALVTGVDPHTVIDWGGLPAECNDYNGFYIHAWITFAQQVSKVRYEQWRNHPACQAWFKRATYNVLPTILHCEEAGLGVEVLDMFDPMTHQQFLRFPEPLDLLVKYAPSPTTVVDMAAQGALCDKAFRDVLAIREYHIRNLLAEWHSNTNQHSQTGSAPH